LTGEVPDIIAAEKEFARRVADEQMGAKGGSRVGNIQMRFS